MSMGASRAEGQVAMLGVDMAFLVTNPPTPRTTADRRREPRCRPSYLRFYSPVPGTIVDLSQQGMAVRTTVEMPVGREVHLRVRHRSRLFTLTGVVAWLEVEAPEATPSSQAPAAVLLGIEFVEALALDVLDFMTVNRAPVSS